MKIYVVEKSRTYHLCRKSLFMCPGGNMALVIKTSNTILSKCPKACLNARFLLQVLIFPSQKASPMSSANIWLHVVGSHAETDVLHVPRGVLHFSFWSA